MILFIVFRFSYGCIGLSFTKKEDINLKSPLVRTALFRALSGGAGGIRTLVRTRKPYAFYTLIPAFGFRAAARPGPPTDALSSKISHLHRGIPVLFPILRAPLDLQIRNITLGVTSRPVTW